jgi:hypothetical protein
MLARFLVVGVALAMISPAVAAQIGTDRRPDTYGGGEADRELSAPAPAPERDRLRTVFEPEVYTDGDVTWCQRNAVRQINAIDKLSAELVALVEGPKADRAGVARRADKIAELSRQAWHNIQYRHTSLPKPPTGVAATNRPVDVAGTARAVRRLATAARDAFIAENTAVEIDVKARRALLATLEELNRVALGLRAATDRR